MILKTELSASKKGKLKTCDELHLQLLGLSPRVANRGMTSAEFREALRFSSLGKFARFGRTLRGRVDASSDRGTSGLLDDNHKMAQTTLDDWAKDPVDPEIRAHVYSLITAVSFFLTAV